MTGQPSDSYLAALLCLGAIGGIALKAAIDRLLAAGVVEGTPVVATIVVATGLFTTSLLLIHDDEQQRYGTTGGR